METIKQTVARTFNQLANVLETGSYGTNPKIAITGIGSEHGEEVVLAGAVLAARRGADVYYIGTLENPAVTTIPAESDDACHRKMEELLDSGAVDAAVTMHYPFPIGVSTVGRIATPAKGKEMFIATTTGASSTDRTEGMIKNALYGIIAAKTCGIPRPTVGLLNIDGARQAEATLRQLCGKGYDIALAESARADGGAIMRGNDVLLGVPDVLVCDPLTGNVLMKMLSSYTTGGSYEAAGYGYGPGIGSRNSGRLVLIVSRASGAPVIANAIDYAAQLVSGNLAAVAETEFEAADQAGLGRLLQARKNKTTQPTASEQKPPKSEPVTGSITGIEVMDIDSAVQVLWKNGIYAESGMGCTGPLVMMSEKNHDTALELLTRAGYVDQANA